jgi:hypothetical protein
MTKTQIGIMSFFAGLLVIGGILFLLRPRLAPAPVVPEFQSEEVAATSDESTKEEWTTYRNDVFGFSIEHPTSWEIAQSNENGTPMVTIYKPGSALGNPDEATPPYTHWTNATHVSVYPSGIPTEGVGGLTRPSTVKFTIAAKQANDHLVYSKGASMESLKVEDGAPWATLVSFENPPVNWRPWGFVWAGLALPNMATVCFRNGEEIKNDQCDPLAGDEIIHIGTPEAADRAIEERMLASFKFLD